MSSLRIILIFRDYIMGELRVSRKELEAHKILLEIESGKLTMKQGANRLGISLRQLRRKRRRHEDLGLEGLVHKSRGKPSGRAFSKKEVAQIIRLLNERYSDFGPTLASEKLSNDLGKFISREKIRQLQIDEGLHKPKKRRNGKYHPRRQRRSRVGELVQADGSIHRWLENRAEAITLITFIDDATSRIMYAGFVESESTDAYMGLTRSYVEVYGCPRALYVDKHSIFRQNDLASRERGKYTNYGKALMELGIELICANSPQAKGRVERGFGTLQDRLVKEMRLANIRTMEEANGFLPGFIEEYNQRFSVAAKEKENAHRPFSETIDLKLAFTCRETRQLSKTLTFQYERVLYQVNEPNLINRLKNQKVEIRTSPEREMKVVSKWGQSLKFEVYEEIKKPVQKTLGAKDFERLWVDKRRKPGKHHPWK